MDINDATDILRFLVARCQAQTDAEQQAARVQAEAVQAALSHSTASVWTLERACSEQTPEAKIARSVFVRRPCCHLVIVSNDRPDGSVLNTAGGSGFGSSNVIWRRELTKEQRRVKPGAFEETYVRVKQ